MQVHDFSVDKRYWGHNFKLINKLDEDGLLWEIAGWCKNIKIGDILLLGCDTDHLPAYKVKSIDYCGNPKDMFFAEVEWIKRSTIYN